MTEFGMQLPFVTVASKGGPYEDTSYCAGYEMGQLDAKLAHLRVVGGHITLSVTMSRENLPQADLIAMHHGFVGAVVDQGECAEHDHTWAVVNYSPATQVDGV